MRSTREERRADLTRRYLIGIGFAGIFIVGDDISPRLMLVTDLAAAILKLEEDQSAIVLRRFWFSNAAVATRVCERATQHAESYTRLLIGEKPSDHLSAFIAFAADALGSEVRDDKLVVAQCAAAVEEIERAIDAARTSGGLKDVNQAYKQHRIEMGKSAFPYEQWLHGYKIKTVEAAARRVRSVLRSSTA